MKRVNITYSVEFKDVPKTVKNLVNETHKQLYLPLNDKFSTLLELIKNGDSEQSIQNIDDIRLTMAKIDLQLLDYSNILSGYQKALSTPDISQSDEKDKE